MTKRESDKDGVRRELSKGGSFDIMRDNILRGNSYKFYVSGYLQAVLNCRYGKGNLERTLG
jgi:hypothetical protein